VNVEYRCQVWSSGTQCSNVVLNFHSKLGIVFLGTVTLCSFDCLLFSRITLHIEKAVLHTLMLCMTCVQSAVLYCCCALHIDSSSNVERRESSVTPGKVKHGDTSHTKESTAREEQRLAEMMIPKKKQRLYRKIMYSRKKTAQESRVLAEKRRQYDEMQKKKRKKTAVIKM